MVSDVINSEIKSENKKDTDTAGTAALDEIHRKNSEAVRDLSKALVKDWQANHMYRRLRFR